MRDRSHDIGCKGGFVTGHDMHTFVKADSLGFIKSTHVPAPIDIDCLARGVTISVAIRAGAMVFTVIPSFDSRDAYECVKPIKPAFDAA